MHPSANYYWVVQKVGSQTHDHNSVESEPILKKITGKLLGKFVVKWREKKSHHTFRMLLHHLVKH